MLVSYIKHGAFKGELDKYWTKPMGLRDVGQNKNRCNVVTATV